MKSLLIICLLFVCGFSYSQTATEKYNGDKYRYEYYDTNGNMIGYKSYNRDKRQWEYYDTTVKQSKPQPLINIPAVRDALDSKNSKYTENAQEIQLAISTAITTIDESKDLSQDLKTKIINRITKEIINPINNGQIKYNIESDVSVDNLTSWIWEKVSAIVKNP